MKLVVGVVLAVAAMHSIARAQPDSGGYIGRALPSLEVDDCPPDDETIDAKRKKASEHFERGEQLYAQGDYRGAVGELVSSYCLLPYYRVLKDIGQAYERDLDYGKAIGYFLKYAKEVPGDAKKEDACSPDPQIDRENVTRRIDILLKLPAHVRIETSPGGAEIDLVDDAGVTAGHSRSGEEFLVLGGRYTMTIKKDGYESETRVITVEIGKPYTFLQKLEPRRGVLRVSVTPNDAKLSLNDRTVGTGRYEERLEGAPYFVTAELDGFVSQRRRVVVLPNQENRLSIELQPQPQVGRRQLIAYAGIGGTLATGALLRSFQDYTGAGAIALGGGVGGLVGGYFLIPNDIPLGTSSMTITGSMIGGGSLAAVTALGTNKETWIVPMAGVGLLAGAAVGYYLSDLTHTSSGDASLINTGAIWGTAAGALFAVSFQTDHTVSGGLVLTGLGMGTVGGVLLSHNFTVSRTHSALIDLSGFIGLIGGLAAESLAYPTGATGASNQLDAKAQEHLANFALGGMAIGLITGGILTSSIDAPKLAPTFTPVPTLNGRSATTYGVTGRF